MMFLPSNPAPTLPGPTVVGLMALLADPVRLRIAHIVSRTSLTVGETAEALGVAQPTVSRHLKTLLEARLLESSRVGTQNYIRLEESRLGPGVREVWHATLVEVADHPQFTADAEAAAGLVARRETDGRGFFATAYEHWDEIRRDTYGDLFGAWALGAIAARGRSVVDLGCGTGWLTEILAQQASRVVGVDSSPEMLEAARRRTAHLANVEVRAGELTRLALADGRFGLALMGFALTYVPEAWTAVGEAVRVLAPGGDLVVIDVARHDRPEFQRAMGHAHPGFAEEDMDKAFRKAGLRQVAVRRLTAARGVKGPELILATGSRPVA
jgi:SAM-dependent methyltransferase